MMIINIIIVIIIAVMLAHMAGFPPHTPPPARTPCIWMVWCGEPFIPRNRVRPERGPPSCAHVEHTLVWNMALNHS